MKPLFKYIFLMFLIPLFAACGGGGGSAGVPGGSLSPTAFSVNAPSTLTLAVGQSVSYQVSGGKSPYFSVTDAPSVSTAVVDGGTLTVGAFSVGDATITVAPTGGGASKVIALKVVSNTKPLQLQAPDTIAMLAGNVTSYVVSGGTPPYRVVSSNVNVLAATAVSGEIRLQALADGTASIQVFDSSGDSSPITRAVTVASSATSLYTNAPSALTMAPSTGRSFVIGGGVAPYSAQSSNSGAVTAAVTGTSLNVNSVADGSASVVVTDAKGTRVTIAVTVTGSTPVNLFTTESSPLTMAPNVVRTSTIGGGVAPYTVSSSDTGVVKATVTGTALTITSVADGFGFVDITDATGRKIFISVTVDSRAPSLFTTESSPLTMAPNVVRTSTIGGGVAPYTVSSSDTGVVKATVTGTALTITSVADGFGFVDITDATGRKIFISVTVSGGTASLFTTAPSALTMSPSVTRPFTIGGGVAPYSVQSSNSGAVTATVAGTNLNVTAVADGSASVVVTDAKGTRVTIAVTVTGSTPVDLFTTAPSALTMSPSVTRSFTIGGGVSPYSVQSSNSGAVTATVAGTNLNVTSVADGAASLVVTDAKGTRVTIAVTVTGSTPADLFTTAPSALTMSPSATRTFTIGGGVAPYQAVSSNLQVVSAGVSGAVLTLTSSVGATGTATVFVTDSRGNNVSLTVTVSSAAQPLSLSPDAITIPVDLPQGARIRIIGGAAPFTVTSGIPAALGAVVESTTVGGVTTYEVALTPKLVADVDLVVVDSAGQTAKMKVTINPGTTGIRLSVNALRLSERDVNRTIVFGVYGAIGNIRVFTDDLKRTTVVATQAVGATPPTVSVTTASLLTDLDVPTPGAKDITITVVDSNNNIATAVITIVDNP